MNIGKKGDIRAFPIERFVAIAIALILISILAYIVWRIANVSPG